MSSPISDSRLSLLSEMISSRMGMNFSNEHLVDLKRGIENACQDFGFSEAGPCIEWLISAPLSNNHIEILAGYLTVGETYFYREEKCFEILSEQILPGIIRARQGTDRHLRIWSAGCCTGEEAYTLAILAYRLLPDISDWNVTILATDINPVFLQKASYGQYGEWSFRNTPRWFKEGYFKKTGEKQYELIPPIKKMVTFSHLNLMDDIYPSLLNETNAMDVIFCRNVLMYFAPTCASRVIQCLHRCLVDGGRLFVGSCETFQELYTQFVSINVPGLTYYQKDSHLSIPIDSVKPSFFDAYRITEVERTEVNFPEFPLLDTSLILEDAPTEPIEEQSAEDSHRTLWEESTVLYKLGDYEKSTEKMLALLSRDCNGTQGISRSEVITLLSRAFANQGKLAEAQEWCKKAIDTDKMNPSLHYLNATIQREQQNDEEAVNSLRRALYLDPYFLLAYFALGNLFQQQGKKQESVKQYENALEILQGFQPEEIVPESEGIPAERLAEIIHSLISMEKINGG